MAIFLRGHERRKDGKINTYWSLVENRRVDGGRKVVQRHVLYLGEINSSQQAAWRKTIEVFETGSSRSHTVALFPEERCPEIADEKIVRIRLDQLELRRPRQWGACWLASQLWEQLQVDGVQLLLERLMLELPPQHPPKIVNPKPKGQN